MTHPQNIKQEAIRLRKQGVSIPVIARRLSISKSTTSNWVSSIPLPLRIRRHLSNNSLIGCEKGREVMRAHRVLEREGQKADATKFLLYCERKFDAIFWKFYAATLFWCEGSKRNLSAVGFINSDPLMMQVFLRALREGFDLDERKFRIVLHLHDYHNEDVQKRYWSAITSIPISQFTKSYHKPNTKIRKREGYQGCVSLKYFDARLAKELDALYHVFAERYASARAGG